MRLTTAPLLLDALVFAPRDMPLETLSSAVVHALLRQLRAARRAASRWCRLSGLAEPGGAGRAAGGGGVPQGLSLGRGALAAQALHFQPGALAHPVTAVLPLPPLGAEVRFVYWQAVCLPLHCLTHRGIQAAKRTTSIGLGAVRLLPRFGGLR